MDPFEQSADMRLLELRRKALGKESAPKPNWSGVPTDMHDGIPLEETPAPILTGARLTVDLAANPKTKLVPGAVVTMSLSVQNIGDRAVGEARILVPIPGGASVREGSLMIDGRSASVSYAEAFFGDGYRAALEAAQRITFVWQLSVEPGLGPLIVTPSVSAANAGVAGGSALLLRRSAPAKAQALPDAYLPPRAEVERPFYELDSDEEQSFDQEFPAGTNAPDTPLVVMPDIQTPEPARAPESPTALEPELEPEPEEPEVLTDARLYSGFDAGALRLVNKMFASESFGQIPHYMLQNSLACSIPLSPKDPGLRAHFAQQAGLLSRALLMAKLKKQGTAGDFATGKTGFDVDVSPYPLPVQAPGLLWTELTPAEADFCAPVGERNHLETFIRIRQLAVALQARRLNTGDEVLRANVERLLESYAAAARAAINRTFIRAKLDRNFNPFGASDPAADALARELLAALSTAFGV